MQKICVCGDSAVTQWYDMPRNRGDLFSTAIKGLAGC